VGAWLHAFPASNGGRRPGLLDAQATGDPVLASRFQQYLQVRQRLLAELPALRREYEGALDADARERRRGGGGAQRAAAGAAAGVPGANANAAVGRTPAQAAQQWSAAVQYRRSHPARPLGEPQQRGAAAAAAEVAAAPISIVGVAAPAAPRQRSAAEEASGAPGRELAQLAEKASSASASDPSTRMRSAALAALQYKQRAAGAGAGARAGAPSGGGGAASAVLQAPVPPRPKAGEPAVIAVVETAKFNPLVGRKARQLDADTRLDVVMSDGGAAVGPTAAPQLASQLVGVAAAPAHAPAQAQAETNETGGDGSALAPADAVSPAPGATRAQQAKPHPARPVRAAALSGTDCVPPLVMAPGAVPLPT
jgi:hypothetical protein